MDRALSRLPPADFLPHAASVSTQSWASVGGGDEAILIHDSPRSDLAHELGVARTVDDALPSGPDGPDAWRSVAFACEESAEPGHQAQDLFEGGDVRWRLLLGQEAGGMPSALVEEPIGGQIWTDPAQP